MKDEWWLELFEQRSHHASVNLEHLRPFSQAYMNGTLDSMDVVDNGLSGSYDMLTELDEFGVEAEELPPANVDSFRSLCISAIRDRSKTVTAKDAEQPSDKLDAGHPKKTSVAILHFGDYANLRYVSCCQT